MSAPGKFEITDDIVDRFAAYYEATGWTWGVFHVVLSDGNDGECHDWAYQRAMQGTPEERELGELWAKLSKSQRHRVARRASERVVTAWRERNWSEADWAAYNRA